MSATRNLKLRGKIWWFKKRIAGEDYEESLQTGSLTVAKGRRDDLIQTLKEVGEKKWRDTRQRTFNQAVKRMAEEHYPTLKPKSRRRYTVSVTALLEVMDGSLLADIGSAKINDFEQLRRKQGVTDATIRRDLACLSVVFTLANKWEWAVGNPAKAYLGGGTSTLKEGDPRTRYLSHEEEANILRLAPPKAAKMIAFSIDTGLRKEELYALKWADVHFNNREIHVIGQAVLDDDEGTKNSKDRMVPLWPRAMRLLRELKEQRTDLKSPYVFQTYQGGRYSNGSPTNYEALQKAVQRCNKERAKAGHPPMAHVEWHDLRRTCGCRLLQDHEFSMEQVSLWLGHSSVVVTERHYAFLTSRELHKAVDASETRRANAELGQKFGHRVRRIFKKGRNNNGI